MIQPSPRLLTTRLKLVPSSLTASSSLEFGLVDADGERLLAVLGGPDPDLLAGFTGTSSSQGDQTLLLCPLNAGNAAQLRTRLPWLKPRPLGLATSVGLGDRLGLATPGHVRAVRSAGGQLSPIFAQQSMREMARSGRTPQQVMDDATWGIFQEGWQGPIGADADHLKTPDDIDSCLEAGFSFFTIDPGEQVDSRAETASPSLLRELAAQLPPELRPESTGLRDKKFQLEHLAVRLGESVLLRAAVKYGRAVAQVAALYRHLERQAGSAPVELEVSVDETDQPTTHEEHIYIASQLKRMGVKWVSLAPRYLGRFEKGVDYIGDLKAFEADLAGHAAIARHFGPYKLSLHSGSDKYSIYPAAMRQTQGRVHLKTAGTSYLEALRTIAELDAGLLREIYGFAREHYQRDRASYHVSAELARAPDPLQVSDWPGLLDQFDAREILHVSFGSVLTARGAGGESLFSKRFFSVLNENRELYWNHLENHFKRHLHPFRPTE